MKQEEKPIDTGMVGGFRTAEVTIRGTRYMLRELSVADTEMVAEQDGDFLQGLTALALALRETGAEYANVHDGIANLRAMPGGVLQKMREAMALVQVDVMGDDDPE